MAAIDWGILIVAASGTFLAALAFLKITRTTGKIDTFLDKLPKNPLKLFTPDFVAETITKTLVKGISHPDGTAVTVPDLIDSYVMKHGPAVMARFEAKLPDLVPLIMNPTSPPQAGQSAGSQLAGQRWTGGLKAAQATSHLGKALGSPKIVQKIQQGVEVVQAVRELVPAIQEIKAELGGGNGGGGGPGPMATGGQAGDVWCPQ